MIDANCPGFLGAEAATGAPPLVSILPAPLAGSLSWGKGAEQGPQAILQASLALETFDDELLIDTVSRVGIETMPPLPLVGLSQAAACQTICQGVERELARDRLPVLLGGEHTVTLGGVAACARRYPDLRVVQVDAHLDLRDRYQDDPLSHACVMRRLDDLAIPFVQVGGRSFSGEEWRLVQRRGWRPLLMSRIHQQPDWVVRLGEQLAGPVYVSFDLDALDPAIMPATGTPEPDGLSWLQAVALIRAVAGSARVVGLDLVEFSPRSGLEHAAFTAAKLLYRALGYLARAQWGMGDRQPMEEI